ncbi:hypothetical protein BDW42DRAFT_179063 [Aspergillus taichungensis]|uniref:Uncharacterized protein n=1 Tax=Aspergillus taichungensis TaxID=482145 RepID=A0A2J5HH32_9EURO|nr:hypothetical protein BDW42DRAFT_179063 [Aspergillus taichungensis]
MSFSSYYIYLDIISTHPTKYIPSTPITVIMLQHKPTRITLDETDLCHHLAHIYARHPEYYHYFSEGDDYIDGQPSVHSDTPSSSAPTHISESICDREDDAPAGQDPYHGPLSCHTTAEIIPSSRSSSGSVDGENSPCSSGGSDSDDEIAVKPLEWSGGSRSPWVTARYADEGCRSRPQDDTLSIHPDAQSDTSSLHTAIFSTVYDKVLGSLPSQQDLFHPLKPLLYSPLLQDRHGSPTQTCLILNKEIEELCANTTGDSDHHSTGGLMVQLTNLIDLALSSFPGNTVYHANRMAKRGRAGKKQDKAGMKKESSGLVSMNFENGNIPVWDINENASSPHAEEERKETSASDMEVKIAPVDRRCDFSAAMLRETNEPPRPYDRSILDVDPRTTFVNENVIDTKRRGQDNETHPIMYPVRPERKAVNHGLVHPILMEAYHFHNYVNSLIIEVKGSRVDDITELGLRDLEPFKVLDDETVQPGGGDENVELDS